MSLKSSLKNLLPDGLVDFFVAIQLHVERHKAFPSLFYPKTFNEKIFFRKLHDRRAILATFADKYAVRDFVAKKIGADFLPKLYCITDDPKNIPFDSLPDKFVIKPTHGSGWIKMVNDKNALNREEIIRECEYWLSVNYYEWTREWAYKDVKPQIIIEEFLQDSEGKVPNDYKMFVFGGRVEFVQVDLDRYGYHRRDIYTRDWKKLNVTFGYDNIEGGVLPPPHYEEMLRTVDKLCEGVDFVRADFYYTDRIIFGELTGTPGNGLERFFPGDFDAVFGDKWKQDTRNVVAVPEQSSEEGLKPIFQI